MAGNNISAPQEGKLKSGRVGRAQRAPPQSADSRWWGSRPGHHAKHGRAWCAPTHPTNCIADIFTREDM
jgi:hypothetical protein